MLLVFFVALVCFCFFCCCCCCCRCYSVYTAWLFIFAAGPIILMRGYTVNEWLCQSLTVSYIVISWERRIPLFLYNFLKFIRVINNLTSFSLDNCHIHLHFHLKVVDKPITVKTLIKRPQSGGHPGRRMRKMAPKFVICFLLQQTLIQKTLLLFERGY